MPETLLWSIRETAVMLGGVSVRTIERMIDDGELSVIYVRKRKMIAADIVRQWLAAQNERARARMEETRPCREKTAMASTNRRCKLSRRISRTCLMPLMIAPAIHSQ